MTKRKYKSKKKKKSGNKYFRSATDKAIGGIITAGVVLPLTFTAVKKGGEAIAGFGAGVEGLGNIGQGK